MMTMVRCAALVGAGFVVMSCAPRDSTVSTSNPLGSGHDEILSQRFIAELVAETERTRELQMLEPVDAVTMTADEVRQLVQEQVAEVDMTVAQRIMQAFGFIPEGLDLGTQMVDLLSEEVLGMYDPDDDQLIVLQRVALGLNESSMDALMARMVLVHELTHALQDQHFETLEHTGEEVWSDDGESVYSCLAEGDATLTMFISSLRQKGAPVDPTLHPRFREVLRSQGESALPQSSAMSEAPPYFGHVLAAIYLEGAAFVADMRRLGGWRAVDAAHRRPPRSTRDILHTEHYLTGRGIVELELPGQLSGLNDGGYERVASAVLGELEAGAFLLPVDDLERLRTARDGWAGDRFAVYEATNGALALVWRLRFEEVSDATEYASAAHDAVIASGRGPCEDGSAPAAPDDEPANEASEESEDESGENAPTSTPGQFSESSAPDITRVLCNEGRDLIARQGDEVVILRNVPAAAVSAIAVSVMAAPSRTREVEPPQPSLLSNISAPPNAESP